jgi:exopolysaccharide biosynthesis protein
MDTGECLGDLVSNGTVFQLDDTDSGYASWGLTRDGRWVFGDVGPATVESDDVVELISGFVGPLLVEGGVGAVSSNSKIAQRTAAGIDAMGRLLLLTIDGAETPPRGMNLTELGAAFAALGATTALNLDGGGSTVAWMDGEYVDRPTCKDRPFPECERTVASAVCVMPASI